MRTTINIDGALLSSTKEIAAKSGRSLGSVIEDALRESLGRRSRGGVPVSSRLPVHHGRTLAGVDIDNSAALVDLIEER
ncbi:MAG TPA: hypothetical protein VMU77_01825 [Acidimicrobiales bacterium]|nr:hypothetical protein [Acidimicrobiales bacterium]